MKTVLVPLCVFLGVVSMPPAISYERVDDSEYRYLDQLACQAGTDKSSKGHNYTRVYAKYFSSLKNKPIKFLEIGIYKGESVTLWENYFPNAELHFIDIEQWKGPPPKRAHFHVADQESSAGLHRFLQSAGGAFDLIIDDGGHTMNQQITSFVHLFPALKSGGIYVIEDLHTSYWTEYGGGGSTAFPKSSTGSAIEFLKEMIDDVNYVGAKTGFASFAKARSIDLTYYQKNIESMHFYDSLCFIIKR
ncbi:MAG: 8-demethyl-8-alpha-L-rhamnosyl tetracenomycin-C 2'-O-methyltransferase [Chlamydiales bacterium]|nr:8-demethyl-8-alpha-L-rhamnosyl tetracenomycin-C 2'-O-methyltransferase [Chlamydiales bacterium]